MLTLEKIKVISFKRLAVGLFAVGVVTGAGVSFAAGIGAGAASAATNANVKSATVTNEGAAVTYAYTRMSADAAYPFYITAAFTAAGGMFMYALTYVPVRTKAHSRSQYPSRVTTWAKTTY